MPSPTLIDTFKVLRDSPDWLNSVEIAHQANRGNRTCHIAATTLKEAGALRFKTVDKRHYWKMYSDDSMVKALPLIVDINESISIKDNKA